MSAFASSESVKKSASGIGLILGEPGWRPQNRAGTAGSS